MVAAPGMLLIVGKKLKGRVPPVPYRRDSVATVTRLINLRRKIQQLLSSFLYYFSLSYMDQPSTGAEVGRFERFVLLFFSL